MTHAATERANILHRRRGLPAPAHLAAVLLLCLAVAIRFYPVVTSTRAKTDERVYLNAFRALAAGESPYAAANPDDLGFYYPPSFAVLGAAALDLAGSRTVVLAMRAVNILGLACCLWCSFLFAPLTWRWCLLAAVLYLALAPVALVHGLRSGNLSFAVVGSSLVGLAAWRSYPVSAGLLLGVSTLIKPIAPVGLVTLAGHRPSRDGRQHLLASGIGLALAGAATLASPFLTDYLALDADINEWPLRRSVSLYRWLHLMGLPLPPAVLLALVALTSAWLARRKPIRPRQLMILAIVGMILATPALWSHTLLLALPLQIMALGKAWRRRRSGDRSASPLARYELIFVVLGAAALQFADGIGGGVETAPVPLQLLALSIPVWAPLGLAAYAWRNAP